MRILWSSNAPWAPSGYGQQTALFCPRIKALGHEVAIHAWYGLQGSVINWEGIPLFPSLDPNSYGQDIQDAHAANWNADITITLIDAWVMRPETYNVSNSYWCPWFPVDAEPCPPLVVDKVRQAFAPIVFSEFGREMVQNAGIEPLYVPHGYDGKTLYPMHRNQARAELGIPPGAFVVGMVAANKDFPPRKAFPQVLEAFARFCKDKPDAFLHLHTAAFGGQDLMGLHERLGLKGRVVFADPYALATGNYIANGDYMRRLYNSFDVLLSPSLGEGFGVPILEAQACGVPVITGDWTAMPEITHNGWCIPKSCAEPFHNGLNATMYTPHVDEIVKALELAYERKRRTIGNVPDAIKEYEADIVTEMHWKPALEHIEARINGAKEMEAMAKCAA